MAWSRRFNYPLQFPAGWEELAAEPTSPALAWLARRVTQTQATLQAQKSPPAWAGIYADVHHRWQQAAELFTVECVAWSANSATGQGARLEKSLAKLKDNIAQNGWAREGLSFYQTNRYSLEPRRTVYIDIRDMSGPQPQNRAMADDLLLSTIKANDVPNANRYF